MGKDVIVACDFAGEKQCIDFLDLFKDEKPFVKIGMELFYASGPGIVNKIKDRGHRIFLDLKLHDIPNTVGSAMKVLSSLDVDMVNVHASGGIDMMKAAKEALTRADGTSAKLIAVTILTSISKDVMNSQIGISGEVVDAAIHLASNAKEAGLDGVVCSPHESKAIHYSCGSDFLTVTPGVRYPTDDLSDQSRVMTPANASAIGSDYIVVGRPITRADDPIEAYRKFVSDFCN